MSLHKDTIKELRKKFPDESIQSRKGFKDPETGKHAILTGIKPQYIIERLNDALGHENWDFNILEYDHNAKSAWVKGRLTVYASKQDPESMDGPITRGILTVKEQFGNSSVASYSMGDTFKAAATNSLEKCASMLDIAHEAYKGLIDLPSSSKMGKETEKSNKTEELIDVCKKHKINKEAFPVLTKTVFKKEILAKDLSVEQMQQLIDHLEKNGAPF